MTLSRQYVTDLSETGITFATSSSLEWMSRCTGARTPLANTTHTSFHTSGKVR